jgi:putative spermidine/putrescine transport system substrate-binding protein
MTKFARTSAPLSRRGALKAGLASVATVCAPAIWTPSMAANKQLLIRDSGGPYTKAFEIAFYKPFTEATGIEVVSVTSTSEPTAQVKAMVEAKSYTWDIVGGLTRAAVKQLAAAGLLEKHELEKDPLVSEIPPQFMLPHGVGTEVYTTVLGYRKDRFPSGKEPSSWADFWNFDAFPGRRGLRKFPIDTLEIAALASGVSPAKLYPIDTERSFKELDLIKPKISAWWTGGAQATQMLATGEVDMVATWVTRVAAASDAGVPVGIVWNQNLWSVDYWTIPKGAPNADLCRQFIKFACDPKRQAAFAPYILAGPTNPNAYRYIDPARAKLLPTYSENLAVGIQSDDDFWSVNKDKLTEAFNAWLLR